MARCLWLLLVWQALNEDCFEVLLRHFDCRFECFASPLNSRCVRSHDPPPPSLPSPLTTALMLVLLFHIRYGRFCSAFADVDMAFGSIGSLFDFRPTQVPHPFLLVMYPSLITPSTPPAAKPPTG